MIARITSGTCGRNKYPLLTYEKAKAEGIATARLPIAGTQSKRGLHSNMRTGSIARGLVSFTFASLLLTTTKRMEPPPSCATCHHQAFSSTAAPPS